MAIIINTSKYYYGSKSAGICEAFRVSGMQQVQGKFRVNKHIGTNGDILGIVS